MASENIVNAFKEAFEASPEQSLALEAPTVELALAFRHQCLYACVHAGILCLPLILMQAHPSVILCQIDKS